MLIEGSGHEDSLNISAHIYLSKKSVTLIEDEMFHFRQIEDLKRVKRGREGYVREREGGEKETEKNLK